MGNKELSEKLRGIIELSKAGLPVLNFKIIEINNDIESQVKEFLKENFLNKYMIRTDKVDDKYGTPSINNATLNNVKDIIKLIKDYTVFIMEPGTTKRNLHVINILKDDNEIVIEAVGPGFIARDMNILGNVHELIIIDLNHKVIDAKILVKDEEYQKHREEKIKREKYLENELGNFIYEYKNYVPLTESELNIVKHYLPKLDVVANKMGSQKYVASMSFLDKGDGLEPVFWDIYKVK